MRRFFVPYLGRKPACVCIKGHRLLILCSEKGSLARCLGRINADRIKEVRGGESVAEEEQVLGTLARLVNGGVVVAPYEMEVPELLFELETELPWLQ